MIYFYKKPTDFKEIRYLLKLINDELGKIEVTRITDEVDYNLYVGMNEFLTTYYKNDMKAIK